MRKAQTVAKVPYLAPDVSTKVIPSPTDGWDAISPLAEMDPKRAVILNNWVPRPGFVELRGGSIIYSSILSDNPVESLFVYRSPTGEQFFAAGNGEIWDLGTPTTPVRVLSGFTNNRWQYVNFTPAGGDAYIQLVNGEDPLQMYNGTTWTAPAITGTLVNGDTVSTSAFINITVSKRRLWYVVANTSIAAFMPVDAVMGPIAGSQDFANLWNKGGYLVAMGAWTIDGGSGPQDYAVFISSRGQITIYSGTDPTNAATWQLVGTFDASPPVGRRCIYRVGSDLAMITQDGVLPISQTLPFDPSADRSVAITARIQNAMSNAVSMAKSNFGWQVISYPLQQLLVLNVPLSESSYQVQYVMNTLTGGWCQFIGWNANCYEIFNDNLYFGDNDGGIVQAYTGSSDGGDSIIADMQCAFNWLDEPGRIKRMTLLQPLMTSSGQITPSLAVDTDFQTSTAVAPVSVLSGGALWDVALWDEALWPAITFNFTSFLSVSAIGHCFAVRMRVNVSSSLNPGASGVFDVGVFDSAVFDGGFSPLLPSLQINAFTSVSEAGGVV